MVIVKRFQGYWDERCIRYKSLSWKKKLDWRNRKGEGNKKEKCMQVLPYSNYLFILEVCRNQDQDGPIFDVTRTLMNKVSRA